MSSHNDNTWFKKARTYNLPLFLEQAYQMEVSKSNKCLCPFHADTKPTLSLKEKGGEWVFKCFSCDATGDITKFVEMKERLMPLDAVRKILKHHGENIDVGEQKPLSEEALKAIAQRDKKAEEAKVKKSDDELADKKSARLQMTKASEHYAQNLFTAYEQGNEEIIKSVESKFKNIYNNVEIRDAYMGWDYDNQCMCIINRNDEGETFNIKSEFKLGSFKDDIFSGVTLYSL